MQRKCFHIGLLVNRLAALAHAVSVSNLLCWSCVDGKKNQARIKNYRAAAA